MCTCSNGVVTVFTAGDDVPRLCEVDDLEDCSSCDLGYYLSDGSGNPSTATTGGQTCEQCTAIDDCTGLNALSCTDGTDSQCTCCDEGYTLVEVEGQADTCVESCSCPNGTPTEADAALEKDRCETPGTEDCKACNVGYHPDPVDFATGAQTCQPNMCTCSNGVVTVFTAGDDVPRLCEVDDLEDCSSCDLGYYLSDGSGNPSTATTGGQTCEQCTAIDDCTGLNALSCTDGTDSQCTCCDEGYTLVEVEGQADTCEENVCTCPNGTPTTGTDCAVDGTMDCSGCNEGYHNPGEPFGPGGQECVPNFCYCPNGTPTEADGATAKDLCASDDVLDCKACNEGYTESAEFAAGEQECEPLTCASVSCSADSHPVPSADSLICLTDCTEELCCASNTCTSGWDGVCGADRFTTLDRPISPLPSGPCGPDDTACDAYCCMPCDCCCSGGINEITFSTTADFTLDSAIYDTFNSLVTLTRGSLTRQVTLPHDLLDGDIFRLYVPDGHSFGSSLTLTAGANTWDLDTACKELYYPGFVPSDANFPVEVLAGASVKGGPLCSKKFQSDNCAGQFSAQDSSVDQGFAPMGLIIASAAALQYWRRRNLGADSMDLENPTIRVSGTGEA